MRSNSCSPSALALKFSRLMSIMLKQTEEGCLRSRTSGNKSLINSNVFKYVVLLSKEHQCASSVLVLGNFLRIFFPFFKNGLLCFLKMTHDMALNGTNMKNSLPWCFSVVECNSTSSIKKKKNLFTTCALFLQMNKGILLH